MIPDYLSTGIDQIVKWVDEFGRAIKERIEIFKTKIPEGNAIASSAEFTKRGTLRQKYAYQGGYETFPGPGDRDRQRRGDLDGGLGH
jgi:hypothetical protein